jgi:hypothetical protein
MSLADWLFQASVYFPSSIIVGALALFGVWWTLSRQAELQRAEWDQRETAHQNELRAREQAQHRVEEQRYAAAMRSVSIEALNNAVALLTFNHLTKESRYARFPIAISRAQFDDQLPLIAERLSPNHLQQAATVYMEAFRYKLLIDQFVAQPSQLSDQQIKDASNLSLSFSVVFRTLAPSVFAREQTDAFEVILRVAELPPS